MYEAIFTSVGIAMLKHNGKVISTDWNEIKEILFLELHDEHRFRNGESMGQAYSLFQAGKMIAQATQDEEDPDVDMMGMTPSDHWLLD